VPFQALDPQPSLPGSGGIAAPAVPDIGYADTTWPDPLAADSVRLTNLADAWRRMMGYYQAGGPGLFNPDPMAQPFNFATAGTGVGQPSSSGNVTYITPARQAQIDKGQGYSSFHRRLNVANVKALRRSMRRLSGFEKLARRVISFTKPHAGRRFKFHHKKKRA
jgi:hypothetical protein